MRNENGKGDPEGAGKNMKKELTGVIRNAIHVQRRNTDVRRTDGDLVIQSAIHGKETEETISVATIGRAY